MPRLVTVSGQEIELYPDGSYTLGRDPWCDVVVQDRACSRRHARIAIAAGNEEAWLEDTGSRNGTFLNGTKLSGPTLIPDGGQVRLGSTIFIFTYKEQLDVDLGGETKEAYSQDTLFLEGPLSEGMAPACPRGLEQETGIGGQLSAVSLTDLLQILTQTGRNGTLHCFLEDSEARVEIRSGRVLSASFLNLQGLSALHALAREQTGKFQFVESDVPCSRTIELPTPQLLLELCRALDESRACDPTS